MKVRITLALLAGAISVGLLSEYLAQRAGRGSFGAAPLVASAASRTAGAKAPPAKPAPKKPARPAPKSQRKLVAYYFHGNFRCASCRKIEAWTADTLRKSFSNDLRTGRLEWRVVNIEKKGNEHFEKEYQLYTRSVVLSDTKDGKQTRWKNLGLVWSYLGDEARFKQYVRDEVAAYLKGA